MSFPLDNNVAREDLSLVTLNQRVNSVQENLESTVYTKDLLPGRQNSSEITTLGYSDNRWNAIYATDFYGNVVGGYSDTATALKRKLKINFEGALIGNGTIDTASSTNTITITKIDPRFLKGYTNLTFNGTVETANKLLNNPKLKISGDIVTGSTSYELKPNQVNTINVTLSSETTPTVSFATPKANAGMGGTGTSIKYSRPDHRHPIQTSITGHANTTGNATKSERFSSNLSFQFVSGAYSEKYIYNGYDDLNIEITRIDASKFTTGSSAPISITGNATTSKFATYAKSTKKLKSKFKYTFSTAVTGSSNETDLSSGSSITLNFTDFNAKYLLPGTLTLNTTGSSGTATKLKTAVTITAKNTSYLDTSDSSKNKATYDGKSNTIIPIKIKDATASQKGYGRFAKANESSATLAASARDMGFQLGTQMIANFGSNNSNVQTFFDVNNNAGYRQFDYYEKTAPDNGFIITNFISYLIVNDVQIHHATTDDKNTCYTRIYPVAKGDRLKFSTYRHNEDAGRYNYFARFVPST